MMLEVTAAVLCRKGHILICQRPEGKNCALLWEFPGGKIEPGETGADCIRRECREELDLDVTVLRELTDVIHEVPDKTVHLHFFLCAIPADAEPVLKEHASCAWVRPESISNYAFCPADTKMLSGEVWRNFARTL